MNYTEFDLWLRTSWKKPLVMGVVNVTPDSFSDAGQKNLDPASAVAAIHSMAGQGADIIDLGAESTRPGSEAVAADEQIRRLAPVLEALQRDPVPAVLSVDTTQSAVAYIALELGVLFINDISAGRDDPQMLPLVAKRGATVCLMHMQGTPQNMQRNPAYGDVVAEVKEFLTTRVSAAERAGIEPHRVVIDPGIGFGKTVDHNLELLKRLTEFHDLRRPILVGTSRKGFIGRITGVDDPARRQFGTAATVCHAVANGAAIVRVHDVEPMVQVVRMTMAMMRGRLE